MHYCTSLLGWNIGLLVAFLAQLLLLYPQSLHLLILVSISIPFDYLLVP